MNNASKVQKYCLIGSCSSGLSSTVMCYIAKASLALSLSITTVSTLAAAIMTPIGNVTGSLLANAWKNSADKADKQRNNCISAQEARHATPVNN